MGTVFGTPPRRCSWTPAGRTEHGTRYRATLFTADDLASPGSGPASPMVLHMLATSHRTLLGSPLAVYLPGPGDRRNEDPNLCVGVVTALDVRGREVVATFDIRDADVDLIRYDVSAVVSQSYEDTRTGRPAGPAVLRVDLRPTTRKAPTMSNPTPGQRFFYGEDGVLRRVPSTPAESGQGHGHRVMPNHLVDHHVARLSAEAEEMGLTRSATGTAPRQPGTAAQIARYTAMADRLGIGEASSVELPSLGRG